MERIDLDKAKIKEWKAAMPKLPSVEEDEEDN